MTDFGHILIVDDDREIRTLLGDYSQKNGYRTTAVAGGGQGYVPRARATWASISIVLDPDAPAADDVSKA